MNTYLGYQVYNGSVTTLNPAPELLNEEGVVRQNLIPKHALPEFRIHSTTGWFPKSLGKIPGSNDYIFQMNGFENGDGRTTHNIVVPKGMLTPSRRMLPRRN